MEEVIRKIVELKEAEARLWHKLLAEGVNPPAKADESPLLTLQEAADQLNVSPRWFADKYALFDTIELSSGAYRIPQSAVDRYIESRRMG